MPFQFHDHLHQIAASAIEELSNQSAAREKALRWGREVIQLSAHTIRAVHRREFAEARELLKQAEAKLEEARATLRPFPEINYAGYLHDARKEYAEASIFSAIIEGNPIPTPSELKVELSAYLNGLGEAAGELRRYILDSLRSDEPEPCEELLEAMDDIYTLLIAMDFPDAITGGLRRTTDMVRGVLERTRGDLTSAILQRRLGNRLASFEKGHAEE